MNAISYSFRRVLVLLLVAAASAPGYVWAGPQQDAAKLMKASGVQGGLLVHVGCGDGSLAALLGADDAFLVHGLDRDAANVKRARALIRSKALYGRVSVEQWTGKRLPYADNLLNLLVVDTRCEIRDAGSEILRVLTPRGVAIVRAEGNEGWLSRIPHPVSRSRDGFAMFRKPVPSNIGEWTHWNHGPDGNRVTMDSVAGPPRRQQWVSGPLWARHHDMLPNISAIVTAGGRLFYIMDESQTSIDTFPGRWSLLARDAFNGLLLWRRGIKQWGATAWNRQKVRWEPHGGLSKFPLQIHRRLVATGNEVFVTLGFNAPVTVLDPETGEVKRTLPNTESTEEILHRRGTLYLSIKEPDGAGKRIVAANAGTGQLLWRSVVFEGVTTKSDDLKLYTHMHLVLGQERLFFLSRDRVICLNLKNGRQQWQFPFPSKAEQGEKYTRYYYPHIITMVYHDGVVLFAQLKETVNLIPTFSRGTPMTLRALSAKTGDVLWNRKGTNWAHGSAPDLFVIDNTVWTFSEDGFTALGLDPVSGRIKRDISAKKAMDIGHHHRCYQNRATTRYLLSSRRGVEFVDLNSGAISLNHWTRGMCRVGVLPSNGLLYVPPNACGCYTKAKISGLNALAPKGAGGKWQMASDEERLQEGPAYKKTGNRESAIETPHDWPTYRRDGQRSGATTESIAEQLTVKWKAKVGNRVSALTAAEGRSLRRRWTRMR